MEFAAEPFKELLLKNAEGGQLITFLNQLDQQYKNAIDEKERFGILQVLLPIFRAHVTRLNDYEKEQSCLDQYLLQWMQSNFFQDSLSSTESVALLERTVSFLMGRSFLLYSNQPAHFGRTVLMNLLAQLLAAIEAEIEFVGLEPLRFCEEHLRDQCDWHELLLLVQNSNTTKPFDLECCLDILNFFVQDLNENNELQILESTSVDLYPWMKLIYIIAVALMPCTDTIIRNKVTHDLLPNLLRWQQRKEEKSSVHERTVQWCEMLWTRTCQIFDLPATNLLRTEVYGLIARFFQFYFGMNGTLVHKDLRFDPTFFHILQSGLKSSDSVARKYATYILKRIIDFTAKNPDTINSQTVWTRYFNWDFGDSKKYIDYWDDWFLLYDIMHESVNHLVQPVLPRLETLLHAEDFDATWWIILFYRGFENDTASVRKGILEFIFTREDPFILNKLGTEQDFMFGALFRTVDVSALYQVPTQGTLVSPFGEHLRAFMVHLVDHFEEDTDKKQFLKLLSHHLSHAIGSYAPVLYIMEALTEVQPVKAWGPEELKSLRTLVDRHRNFNIQATKQFLRRLGISAVIRLADTSCLSFSDIAKTIASLVNEYPVRAGSDNFKAIRCWLNSITEDNHTLHEPLQELENRFRAYVEDLRTEDMPEAVLRNQANVLARTTVIVIANDEGGVCLKKVSKLFDIFAQKLRDTSCDKTVFQRLLTLLDALWESFSESYDNKTNLLELLCCNTAGLIGILSRIDECFLTKDKDAIIDADVITLYLSVIKRVLMDEKVLSGKVRQTLISNYYDKCVDMLKYRTPGLNAGHEIAKPGYLGLLSIVYECACKFSYFTLDCDSTLVSFVSSFQMKRTQEALRERTWGDCISIFISAKWNCIRNIVCYATQVKHSDITSKEMFDPIVLFEEAADQLESGSEMCGESIIRSFGPLLAFPWEKTAEMLHRCVDYAIALMKENLAQSKTFPLLIKAFMDVIFQPELLSEPSLNEDDGPIKKALYMVLETGEIKPTIVAHAARLLHTYWCTFTEGALQSMIQYSNEIAKLAVFGPLRDREDQKLEAAIAFKLADPAELPEAAGTVQTIYSQNDYLVRVYMNDLLLRLDGNNEQHRKFANILIDKLVNILETGNLYEFTFESTIEHRTKLRVGCSLLLVIDFAQEDKVDEYVEILFEIMRKETVTSVRCYFEWAMVKLLRRYPDRLTLFYDKLSDTSLKPNYVISLLTITITLCDMLPEDITESYFNEIFVRLMPWMTTNHFTIRLFSYCAWKRNYRSCIQHGFGQKFKDDKYLQAFSKFMDTYTDSIKLDEKVQNQFYMSKFNPITDFNIEFIFRQLPSEFDVIDTEKIGSKAFFRVNRQQVERCPFVNPARKAYYTSADPSEMIATDEGDKKSAAEEERNTTAEGNDGALSAEVYQKKIMPWEIMLETDMDLTKDLVKEKRRRNDLIVVASLIDRLPNLAGLCRTCEIFNASLLVVPTLKIKEDPGFTGISVSSERWMPMMEVPEPDVESFLQSKKEEGYTICGLEQTTTSATLGTYEFPEKCVLLLGKERQGVPAHLLQMLDITIEIPQYGITRSLNVHVSGAICIYEYIKQMQWRLNQANYSLE